MVQTATPTARGAATAARRLAPSQRGALLGGVDAFIFDCDGVIWKGSTLIEGVSATLDMLRRRGKRLLFVTNNSTQSRRGYVAKFESLGLAVDPEEIFSSSFAAAAYLRSEQFPADGKVYVVGEGGIGEELDLVGISHCGGPADSGTGVDMTRPLKLDPAIRAVVVGLDRDINCA
jgi:phosphoglycolate phosphatase